METNEIETNEQVVDRIYRNYIKDFPIKKNVGGAFFFEKDRAFVTIKEAFKARHEKALTYAFEMFLERYWR